VPTLNDVLAGSLAQAVQVQQIIDALKGTPNKGVPVALVSLNDPNNYALTVQNDDPTNSKALSVLKADGTPLVVADATGVTLGAPVNLPANSINGGTAVADGSITNAKLGPDVARANLLVNPGFEWWQRGNGPYTANNAIGPDMWKMQLAGSDTYSLSRDTANVDTGSGACAAVSFTLGTGAGATVLYQGNLGDMVGSLNGVTVSLSMRVRTSVANAVRIGINNYYSSTSHFTYSGYHSGSGAYQTLTVTATLSPAPTVLQWGVFFAASCTAYLDNACLVVGSQAATYVPLHPADDLARCLRYYEAMALAGFPFAGQCTSTTQAFYPYLFKVRKAVTPTMTASAPSTWQGMAANGAGVAATAVTAALGSVSLDGGAMQITTASGLVAGNASVLAPQAGASLVAEGNP